MTEAIKTPGVKYAILDVWRGVAVALVFFYHIACDVYGKFCVWAGDWYVPKEPWLGPIGLGWSGVSIFFVISGFCIQLSIARTPEVEWGKFFVRRFFRIYPPYFVALVVFSLVFPLIGWLNWTSLVDFSAHAFLIHNLVKGSFMSINPSFWSIAIEWQLYLLFPVLCIVGNRYGWAKTFLALFILEFGLRSIQSIALVNDWGALVHPMNGLTLMYWFSWSLGVVVAKNRESLFGVKTKALLALGIGFYVVAIVSYYWKPLHCFSFLFVAFGTACALQVSLSGKVESVVKSGGWIVEAISKLGLCSYSIYLVHQPIIGVIGNWLRSYELYADNQILQAATLVVSGGLISLIIAAVCYRYIEVPSHNFGKRVSATIVNKFC